MTYGQKSNLIAEDAAAIRHQDEQKPTKPSTHFAGLPAEANLTVSCTSAPSRHELLSISHSERMIPAPILNLHSPVLLHATTLDKDCAQHSPRSRR